MNLRALVLCFAFPLVSACVTAASGQSAATEQPKFKFEIQPNGEKGPSFTVTNLWTKTLTAAHFRFSVSSQATHSIGMAWDPIWQGVGGPRSQFPGPLEPGASMTMYLPHIGGAPLPDKIEIIAGIWDDGETFGDPAELNLLLNNRTSLALSYEQAIAFLQHGLDENWNRDQYLAALSDFPNSVPSFVFNSIRRTLEANRNPDPDGQSIKLAMQDLLAHFKNNLDLLRPPKSQGTDSNRP
jgi:hypothetical protein